MSRRFPKILSLAPLLLLLSLSPAHAFCTPNLSTGTSCLTGSDTKCDQLGESTMDGDRQNIIACMGTAAGYNCAAGQCQWKAMTSSTTATMACTGDKVMTGISDGVPVCRDASKTLYGGFGGVYSYRPGTCYSSNPFTGKCSCPTGYTAARLTNVNEGTVVQLIHYCFAM